MNRWLKTGLVAAAVSTVVGLGVSRYMIYKLTEAERTRITQTPADFGMRYDDVVFPSEQDRLALRGWYIRSGKSDRCIVMTHGGKSHRADPTIGMLDIAAQLVERGYNVLMFDLRGHGESDDGRMTGGLMERSDLLGAIAFVEAQGIDRQNIGLLGYSLGAATSLLVAAEDECIRAVVADSSWADLTDMIGSQIERHTRMPKSLGVLVPIMARAAYSIDVGRVKPVDAVSRIAPRPILFIHGGADEVVPVESSMKLYHANENPGNELWVVPQAGHVRSYLTQPEEYITRIADFFNEALN